MNSTKITSKHADLPKHNTSTGKILTEWKTNKMEKQSFSSKGRDVALKSHPLLSATITKL
jgi:hypothetical protein